MNIFNDFCNIFIIFQTTPEFTILIDVFGYPFPVESKFVIIVYYTFLE